MSFGAAKVQSYFALFKISKAKSVQIIKRQTQDENPRVVQIFMEFLFPNDLEVYRKTVYYAQLNTPSRIKKIPSDTLHEQNSTNSKQSTRQIVGGEEIVNKIENVRRDYVEKQQFESGMDRNYTLPRRFERRSRKISQSGRILGHNVRAHHNEDSHFEFANQVSRISLFQNTSKSLQVREILLDFIQYLVLSIPVKHQIISR